VQDTRVDEGRMTEAEWLACTDPTPMLEFLRGKMSSQDLRLPSGTVVQVPIYPECKVSDRKMRLFACACCRRLWHLLSDERSRQAIEVAECFVDGLATQDEYDETTKAAQEAAERQYFTVHDAAEEAAASLNPDDPDTQFWVHGAHECASSASAAAHAAWYAAGLSCPPGDAVDAAEKATYALAHDASPILFSEECNPDLTLRKSVEEAEEKVQAALLRDVAGNLFCSTQLASSWRTQTVRQVAEAIYRERAFDRMPILADALEEAGCTNQDILAHCRQSGVHVRGCWVVDLILGQP